MPTLNCKHGVNPTRVEPEILLAIMIAQSVYADHGFDCVITSLRDPAPGRKPNSLHTRDLICRAVDFRITHLPNEMVANICTSIALRLPDGYDVVQETDHLHVEWDPKPGEAA